MRKRPGNWAAAAASLWAASTPALGAEHLVHDQAEYRQVMKNVRAGDVIRLADGVWQDFPVLFEGRGTASDPITLTAQTKGKVILSGGSSLKIAGTYMVVSGLVFRNGHAPGDEVISFRRDARTIASHSRLTEVVIDHFNKPSRRQEDRWVSLYGTDNRVDHSWFAGKGNAGVTLAVVRPKGQPQANRHRIDSNYFGPRPPLGSNGGETLRIGTSDESLSDSATIVENNYFDRCDGEVEIISVKSGGNIIRGNTLFQSQGSVVLRHGNGNLVERNIFLGGGKLHTGGVRIINADQTVRHNYMEGLAGTDFTSAIAVMNGVPGSSINRYHPVSGALITHNSLFDIARITLGAGADAERSAPPKDSRFTSNLVSGAGEQDIIQIDADVRGIRFVDNVASGGVPVALATGIAHRPIALSRAKTGLLVPTDPLLARLGAPADLQPVGKDQTGPTWYPKDAPKVGFDSGHRLDVAPGVLGAAIAKAQPGDTLQLSAGRYDVAAPIVVTIPLTIAGPKEAMLSFAGTTLFQLGEGGSLRIKGLSIRGDAAPGQPGNAVIRSALVPTIANYAVELSGTAFTGMDKAPDFDIMATTAGTFADHISIENVVISGLSGTVVAAAAETGGKGYYPAERISIAGSQFADVGRIADVLRGGTDESTFGPAFVLRNNGIIDGGPSALTLSGVQSTLIADNRFVRAGAIDIAHSVGAPETRIVHNRMAATPQPRITQLYPQAMPRVEMADNIATGVAQ
ncbi:chondroitinase-B domain-containing protein [Sphingobium aromaticiconvertens]|uniref:chondroitinase-B domain-containing protein n=1 Tax=Sphingobium aromaticiconvertens TaxID=365341 RepID=UPI0030161AC3